RGAGGRVRPGLPADRRSAGLRHPATAEEDPPHGTEPVLADAQAGGRARMSTLANALIARFGEAAVQVAQPRGEVTLEVPAADWLAACKALRDEFGFDTFIDLCGVDYLGFGDDEW